MLVTAFVIQPGDNVATMQAEAHAGDTIRLVNDLLGRSLAALERVPIAQKVAIEDIEPGQDVRRFGAPLGRATHAIRTGQWVHAHNLEPSHQHAHVPPHLAELIRSLEHEFVGKPRIASLATRTPEGLPRVRSVIVRHIDPEGAIWISTDARSDKVTHLRANRAAELLFYLPTLRQQYRLAGPVELVTSADEQPVIEMIWRDMSDASRAMFHWPEPGLERSPAEKFPDAAPATELPATFQALRLVPDAVEMLELTLHPHRRRLWTRSGAWKAQELNP